MRLMTGILMLALVFASLGLLSCNTLKTADVTLDISGSSLALFEGFYETTTNGQAQISGSPPKSYTFKARMQYDVVAVQIVRVGSGDLTAKLISGGVTRDSATTSGTVGTLHLEWTPR
jgi:hypothetical protein